MIKIKVDLKEIIRKKDQQEFSWIRTNTYGHEFDNIGHMISLRHMSSHVVDQIDLAKKDQEMSNNLH